MSMFVMVYPGKKYSVMIYYEGEDNGEFIVYNKETNRNIIVIDGLTEYEAFKLREILENIKDIDDWVNTTFEMDKPINGKHAQEYFEDRLCEAIYGKNSFAYRLTKALWSD
jgi:hypothetical protein